MDEKIICFGCRGRIQKMREYERVTGEVNIRAQNLKKEVDRLQARVKELEVESTPRKVFTVLSAGTLESNLKCPICSREFIYSPGVYCNVVWDCDRELHKPECPGCKFSEG